MSNASNASNASSAKWTPIDGAPGYQVSSAGAVLGKRRKALSPTTTQTGYRCVTLSVNGRRLSRRVHRLVAAAFVPNPDGLPQVMHLDGDPRNNSADNLAWVKAGTAARRTVRESWAASAEIATIPLADLSGHAREAIMDKAECAICLDAQVDTVFGPCSHACCCATCAAALWPPRCPICRALVKSRASVRS